MTATLCQVKAPAKINLTLTVEMPPVPSPFAENALRHRLITTMLKIPLYDELTVEKKEQKKITLQLSGPWAKGLPNNQENLVYRAATIFFARTGFSAGINVDLKKNIPPCSGLGGGSSDAAAVLKALQQLFPEKAGRISEQEWTEIAMQVGSDVPFFLSENLYAQVSSFGELVTPLSEIPFSGEKHVILAMLPRITAATNWAYETLDQIFEKNSNLFLQRTAGNQFEIPLFQYFPDLEKLRNDFVAAGALQTGLTGSGAGLFAFFLNRHDMEQATKNLRKDCPFWQELNWAQNSE